MFEFFLWLSMCYKIILQFLVWPSRVFKTFSQYHPFSFTPNPLFTLSASRIQTGYDSLNTVCSSLPPDLCTCCFLHLECLTNSALPSKVNTLLFLLLPNIHASSHGIPLHFAQSSHYSTHCIELCLYTWLFPQTHCFWGQRHCFFSMPSTLPGVSAQWLFTDWMKKINK